MNWLYSASIGPESLGVRLRPDDTPTEAKPTKRTRSSSTAFTRTLRFADILAPGVDIAAAEPESVLEELARLTKELLAEARVKRNQIDWGVVAFAGNCGTQTATTLHCGWGHPRWTLLDWSELFENHTHLLEAIPCTLLVSTAETLAWNDQRFLRPGEGARNKVEYPEWIDSILMIEASEAIVGWRADPYRAPAKPVARRPGQAPPDACAGNRQGSVVSLGSMRPGTLPLAWPGWGATVDGLASPHGILKRLGRILDDEAANEKFLAERFRKSRGPKEPPTTTGKTGRGGAHSHLRERVRTFGDLVEVAESGERLTRSLLLDAATVFAWGLAQVLVLSQTDRVVLSGELFRGDESLFLGPMRQILSDELRSLNVREPDIVVEPPLPGGLLEGAIRRVLAVQEAPSGGPARGIVATTSGETTYLHFRDAGDSDDDTD
jgi:hypothetical protein